MINLEKEKGVKAVFDAIVKYWLLWLLIFIFIVWIQNKKEKTNDRLNPMWTCMSAVALFLLYVALVHSVT